MKVCLSIWAQTITNITTRQENKTIQHSDNEITKKKTSITLFFTKKSIHSNW